MKLSKPLIILLSIYVLIGTYFLTGVVDIALNGKILKLSKYYNASFTFKGLINGYPKIYESLAISFMICIAFIAILLLLPKKEKLYGDARFATSVDIAKRKLYGNDGIIIGKYNGKLLRFPGQQFVSLAAATRGGKGVSVVIPNLMDWQQSAVVQDIKQECFDFTSRYRKEVLGQDVYLFNPFSSKTHRYNPLTYFDINSPEADNTLNSLANIFFPPPASGDPIWSQLSQDLFIGIAYLLGELISTRLGIAFLNSKKIDLDLTFYDILRFSILGLDTQIEEEGSDGEVISVKLNTLDSSYTFLEQCGLVSDKVKMRMKAYVETEAKMKNSVLKS
ncbi:type IV secretory system conjugative DNA transfer family protein, partial [uncultured Campylobacter sp.]|uniref:type IV secretory system conjugative DNA transfer family protein n=1 Tax=uncultured Campylobacter sp. TaxID=218934 RepID=UPI00263504F6